MSTQGQEGKKYGLIIPKRDSKAGVARSSVFDEKPKARPPPAAAGFAHHSSDSELERSDGEKGSDAEVAQPIVTSKKLAARDYLAMKVKSETQKDIDKALSEDPTCFQYDEVYDDISHTSTMQRAAAANKTVEKKPKYIGGLLVAAEQRKREYERRVERQIQKEREAEGEQYVDKEAFVTSAYREKLKQMKADEERERAKEAAEAKMDVTRQGDLSLFYRNLLEETTRPAKNKAEEEQQQKQEADNEPVKDEEMKEVKATTNESRRRHDGDRRRSRSRSRSRSRGRHHKRSRSRSRSNSKSRRQRSKSPHDRRRDRKQRRSPSPRRSPARRSKSPASRSQAPSSKYEEAPRKTSEEKPPQQSTTVFDKRNADEAAVLAARERYLQRKQQRKLPTAGGDD